MRLGSERDSAAARELQEIQEADSILSLTGFDPGLIAVSAGWFSLPLAEAYQLTGPDQYLNRESPRYPHFANEAVS